MRAGFSRAGIVALAAVAIASVSCSRGNAPPPRARTRPTTAAQRAGGQSSGEVSNDSVALPPVQWLTDGNILALLGTMNSQQIAAADVELQSWRSDTVRALAAETARVHAELQHSADSLAARIHLAPVAPAVASDLTTAMQAQIDSLKATPIRSMDRAFIAEQVAAASLMLSYIDGMTGLTERPELQALLSSAAGAVAAELTRVRGLQLIIARGDSATAADSARADSARIHRRRARP